MHEAALPVHAGKRWESRTNYPPARDGAVFIMLDCS
jgi:hypothetical protein